jgi:isopenicillin N synthase-like dioxygenase
LKLNIPKAIPTYANEPKHEIVKENWEEISKFHRDVWEKVARKLFVLIAIILELPENYLADAHAYDEDSDDHLRYMIYNVRSQEEWDRAQADSKGGHTDFGSLTVVTSASHDLALAWHPVLSSSSPLSSLFRRTYTPKKSCLPDQVFSPGT